ncbi:MAG: signal peptidase I [Nitrososphaerota archaeon]|nr:signal peptidase I [Candidatus Bathyarchaeota archaeon]MDW8193362.1 signal peptidase I [Nitrososphaerota archaeon]
MATEVIRRICRNEYIRTALTLVLIFIVIYGGAHIIYLATRLALRTEYPALAVASGSMLPTLNIGDLIIVQGVDPENICADKLRGDILVFRNPYDPSELIVHRAVKLEKADGYYLITTLGDYSRHGEKDQFSPWNSSLLIGKVIARIPYIGNLPLLFQAERGTVILLLAFIAVIFALMLFLTSAEEKPHEGNFKVGGRKIFQFAIANLLIIGLLIFTLWGTFTFPQPGATPSKATIRGVYAEMDFHRSYGGEPLLYWGFMNYQINLQFNDGVRLGVPTFSWAQLLMVALIALNFWELTNFFRERRVKRQI